MSSLPEQENPSPQVAPPRWSTSSRDAVSVLSDGGIHPELPSLLPLSHDHPMLSSSSEKWDVDEFLLTRLHIPLEELRGELREYLGVLKEELGGLINDDYEEFISLGLGLRGEGTRLEGLKYPLQALKVEVQDIHSQLESSESALQSRLDDRTSLRAERAILDTLLHLSESLTRTEGLLGIESTEASHSNGASRTPVKTVEPPIANGKPKLAVIIDAGEDDDEPKDIKTISRIASEYTQVMYLVEKARAEGCEYVTADEGAVEQRIETIRQALFLNLERVLSSTIGRQKHSAPQVLDARKRKLSNCLEVYNTIQGWRQAEQVVKAIVEQDMRDVVTARYLSTAPSPAIPVTPFGMQETNPMSPALMTPHTPMTMTSTITKSTDTNPFESSLSPKDGEAPSRMKEAKLLDEPDNPIAIILNNVLRYVDGNLLDLLMVGERIREKQQSKSQVPQWKESEAGSENGDGASQAEESNTDPESTFEFMANSIWTPIAELIISELGGVLFANGRVTELHQNYTLAHRFVEQLESLAMSVPAVVALRSTDAYQSFEKRWQLPVYFQLRWKEIVKELEEGLTIGSAGITAEQGRDGFALPQTAAVFGAFKSCWAPDIYIPELGFRFWRLALQIISRYRTFIEASVPALYETAVQPSLNQPTPTRSSINLPRSSLNLTGPTLPTGDPSSDAASAQAEDQILKAASLIACDLSKIHKNVSAFWSERVEDLLQRTLIPEEVKRIHTTLDHSLAALSSLFVGPSDHIISILTRRCTDQLKLVRSIASQLRTLTSAQFQETPKPSHFIPNILTPLEDYFGKNGYGHGLKEEVGTAWSRKIIEEVLTAYTSILVSVQKTEDLLRRHRKGKKNTFSLFGSASNASAVSIEEEEERFRKQMVVDIKAFGKASENLGVPPESPEQGELAGWKALLETAERNTTA